MTKRPEEQDILMIRTPVAPKSTPNTEGAVFCGKNDLVHLLKSNMAPF
jgi:hypothetical protein